MGDSIIYCDKCDNRVGCHLARECFHANNKAKGPLDAASCSAFTVREALQRCASTDEGWTQSYHWDAKKCEESDHTKIKEMAAGLISRAEEYELSAARFRSALEWMES